MPQIKDLTMRNKLTITYPFALLGLALLLAVSLTTESTAVDPKTPGDDNGHPTKNWPIFRGNALSQGVSASTLPDELNLQWEFEVKEGAFEATPAIVDGIVYIGDLDGKLYALKLADGKKIWDSKIDSGFVSSVSFKNGRLYVGDYDGLLYCFNAKDGKELWQ